MRKNIAKVIEAFRRGESCIGDSKRTCRTDGRTLYSYDMPIARWGGEIPGRCCADALYLIRYNSAPTATTRSHVRACEQLLPLDVPRTGEVSRVDSLDPFYEFQKLPRRP